MGLVLRIFQDNFIPALVELWNSSATDWHGFFPLTPDIFAAHILGCPRFRPENLLLAEYMGNPIGWIHYDVVDQPPYEKAGVICALLIAPDHRCQGFGSKLLQEAVFRLERRGVRTLVGLGAWPYSPFYATLINGSERAGVPETDQAMVWLLEKYDFIPARKSYTMRTTLESFTQGPGSDEQVYYQSRAGKNTWLDYVFRNWELFDHVLLSDSGQVLSRAIHARMNGLCEHEGKEVHAVFGVNTPSELRGHGYALRNLQFLFARLRAAGAQEAELHVYTDNASALKLYDKLGFRKLGVCIDYRRT